MFRNFAEYETPQEREDLGFEDGYNDGKDVLRETYADGNRHPEDPAYTKGYYDGLDEWWQFNATQESKTEREILETNALAALREHTQEIDAP